MAQGVGGREEEDAGYLAVGHCKQMYVEWSGRVGMEWGCENCTAHCIYVEMILQADAVMMVASHRVVP